MTAGRGCPGSVLLPQHPPAGRKAAPRLPQRGEGVTLGWEGVLWVPRVSPRAVSPVVKNQARWVQQFIADMAGLYGATRDANFNVILVDFDSEDMDVEKALRDARLPR